MVDEWWIKDEDAYHNNDRYCNDYDKDRGCLLFIIVGVCHASVDTVCQRTWLDVW